MCIRDRSRSNDIKVVLLGDAGVGKSSILLRFVTSEFKVASEPTLGAAFMAKRIPYRDREFNYNIWDTAGQEKYHSLAPVYYRDADVAIIVYDITNKASYDVLRVWVKEVKENGPKNIIMAVVGNKCDLRDQQIVTPEEAKKFAGELGAMFTLTSAKENTGIDALFQDISEVLDERLGTTSAINTNNGITVNNRLKDKIKNNQNKEKSGCCQSD
eukprot:TRINITY_DN7905_c0_g3_i1.p1 TRINITY_DN7905_c0_g3~~TRINITY_DN7905_c0_g3_i1.p1  ORF type:complete len:214 (+),score=55.71 TRINITY_DN7905_c0_g3_i1:66-707(+)